MATEFPPDDRRGYRRISGANIAPGERTTIDSPVFDGKPVPEPGPDKSAGPIKPGVDPAGRQSRGRYGRGARHRPRHRSGNRGQRRRCGRARYLRSRVARLERAPATPEELAETARQIKRARPPLHADPRRHPGHRGVARRCGPVEQDFGKIDIVVANAAIQRWKPLLEMEDADWHDVSTTT